LTEADLPSDMQPVNYTYDGKMRLLGYQLHATTVHPAETLPLTLYWQIVAPTNLNYSIFVHLLGRQRQVRLTPTPAAVTGPPPFLPPAIFWPTATKCPFRPRLS
jgi:hypothetical protein